MSSSKSRFSEYAKVARLQTAPIVVFIPLVGALATGNADLFRIILMFIIGFLFHIFAFISNEIFDWEIDKASIDLVAKPLVKGTISKKHATMISTVAISITSILSLIFFFQLIAVILLLISIGYVILYNGFGKKIVGFEIAIGLWAFTFTFFAYIAFDGEPSWLVFLLAILFLIQMWTACAVDGSIKDADHDSKLGVRTIATALGVKTIGKRMILPIAYKWFCMATSMAYICIVFIFYPYWIMEDQIPALIQVIIIINFGTVMLYGQYKMIIIDEYNRSQILFYILIHQCPTVLIPIVLLFSIIGVVASLMLGIFIFTLSTIIVIGIYGRSHPIV